MFHDNNGLREHQICAIKKAVHSDLDYSTYKSTIVNQNTNCFSHAIGSTIKCLNMYRIGAISGRKPTNQNYTSVGEITSLLYADLSVLGLGIEDSFLGDQLNFNQYQIALFIQIYANGAVHDYHFFRNDLHGWSEKWQFQEPYFMEHFIPLNYFPWNLIGIYKITK